MNVGTALTPIIQCPPIWITEADGYGHMRAAWAEERRKPDRNNLVVTSEQNHWIHCLGCRAERAGKWYFDPITWIGFVPGKTNGMPDLGAFIDVKTTKTPFAAGTGSLISPEKDIVHGFAYVLAIPLPGFTAFRFVGWAWGTELILGEKRALQEGRPTRNLPGTVPPLRPMPELRLISCFNPTLPQMYAFQKTGRWE